MHLPEGETEVGCEKTPHGTWSCFNLNYSIFPSFGIFGTHVHMLSEFLKSPGLGLKVHWWLHGIQLPYLPCHQLVQGILFN